jgi:hypothetical protein
MKTGDAAAARAHVYGNAILRAASELESIGADPLEIASGAIGASIQLVLEAAGTRDIARRALIRAADELLDSGTH